MDVPVRSGLVDLRFELLTAVPLADDDGFHRRMEGVQFHERVDQNVELLHRYQPPDRDHEWSRRLLTERGEPRIDSRWHDVHHCRRARHLHGGRLSVIESVDS